MMEGGSLLIDEISLADDSVLERLNSVLEPERKLLLAERTTHGIDNESLDITAHSDFLVFATMNPGGDFGKKEVIWQIFIIYIHSYPCLLTPHTHARTHTHTHTKWTMDKWSSPSYRR